MGILARISFRAGAPHEEHTRGTELAASRRARHVAVLGSHTLPELMLQKRKRLNADAQRESNQQAQGVRESEVVGKVVVLLLNNRRN